MAPHDIEAAPVRYTTPFPLAAIHHIQVNPTYSYQQRWLHWDSVEVFKKKLLFPLPQDR